MRAAIKIFIMISLITLCLTDMKAISACGRREDAPIGYRDNKLAQVLQGEREGRVHPEYIPQRLLDKVSEAMQSGTERETLKPLVNDRELTSDEISALVKANQDLSDSFSQKDGSSAYATDLIVMADGDNDGILDLISRESMGGSDGSTAYVFYQGQKDGSYQKTDQFYAMREEFAILSYEGKNYLCRTLFDYNKKLYNGIGITCYVDGRRAEQVSLWLCPERHKRWIAECAAEAYRHYAGEVLADCLIYYDLVTKKYDNIVGSSEKRLSEYHTYQCDLDNDGAAEQYKKSLSLPSSIHVSEYLDFEGEGRASMIVDNALASLDGMPVMMWVDRVQEKNIVNVMSQTGLDDFTVTGILIQEEAYETLYVVQADAAYRVSAEMDL